MHTSAQQHCDTNKLHSGIGILSGLEITAGTAFHWIPEYAAQQICKCKIKLNYSVHTFYYDTNLLLTLKLTPTAPDLLEGLADK